MNIFSRDIYFLICYWSKKCTIRLLACVMGTCVNFLNDNNELLVFDGLKSRCDSELNKNFRAVRRKNIKPRGGRGYEKKIKNPPSLV